MPEINPAFSNLLVLFFDSGQCLQTGMGLIPLSWQEIDSWIRVNKLGLTIWEIETIKKMSEAYCAEYSRASDPNRIAPYFKCNGETSDEELQIQKAIAMRNAMRSLRKKQ